eukprot:1241006-Rhodomonas_salina.1
MSVRHGATAAERSTAVSESVLGQYRAARRKGIGRYDLPRTALRVVAAISAVPHIDMSGRLPGGAKLGAFLHPRRAPHAASALEWQTLEAFRTGVAADAVARVYVVLALVLAAEERRPCV